MASKKQQKTVDKRLDFRNRVEATVAKEIKLYEKAGIAKGLVIHYPKKRKAPLSGRIGERLLKFSGAEVTTQYIDKQK